MGKKRSDHMLLNDAVKYVMKTTGRSRQGAEQFLLQALKSGKIKARGVPVYIDPVTGEKVSLEPEPIPPMVFQSIQAKH